MIVPFGVRDFLDRATTVYADRTGVVDEPEQPAEPWEGLTYRRVGELARAQALPDLIAAKAEREHGPAGTREPPPVRGA
ncbi:hypothetical protein ABZS63_30720, partial [Streptomyces sp. NPDC005568]